MPSQWGRDKNCPHGCGLNYRKLRTGLKYLDVYTMLMDYSDDPADWKNKRRGTVLGKWHEFKKQMWSHHVDEGGCPLDPRNKKATRRARKRSRRRQEERVPF
jgi:hypothetical protein